MNEALLDIIGDRPATRTIALAILDAWPDHARYLEKSLSARSAAELQTTEILAQAALTLEGARLAELAEGLGGVWSGARRREELAIQALTARHFYIRDKQYVTSDGKVVIVDEFTGRLMPDRTWRDGLHQAIEAKEQLEVNPPKDTYARISFQRFFRYYRKLAGMTGTASEAWREFWQIYHLPVVVIPTNRPCIRKVLPDAVYATESAKWQAVLREVKRLQLQLARGQSPA